MRRLVPPSLSHNDPRAGRKWLGFEQGEFIHIDEEVYLFYKYEEPLRKVKVEEPHTGLLWWFDETYFLTNVVSMEHRDENVMFYTPNAEIQSEVIRKRRQAAREEYMDLLGNRDGTHACQEMTVMANKWWPNTELTRWEFPL